MKKLTFIALISLFFVFMVLEVVFAQVPKDRRCPKSVEQHLEDAHRYYWQAQNLNESDTGMGIPRGAIKRTDLRVAALLNLEFYKLCLQPEPEQKKPSGLPHKP